MIGARWADPGPMGIFGTPVEVDYSGALPIPASVADEAKRIVRRGLADITVRGQSIVKGPTPAPRAATHAIWLSDEWRGNPPRIKVSPWLYEELRMSIVEPFGPGHDIAEAFYHARKEMERQRSDVSIVAVDVDGDDPQDMLAWAREVLEEGIAQRRSRELQKHLAIEIAEWQSRMVNAMLENMDRAATHYSFGINRPRDHFTITSPT